MKIIIGVAAEDETLRAFVLSELVRRTGKDATVVFDDCEELLQTFTANPGFLELYDFGVCKKIRDKSELLLLHGLWLPFHLVCVGRMDVDTRRFGTDLEFRSKELWRFATTSILYTTRPKLLLELGKQWDAIAKKERLTGV